MKKTYGMIIMDGFGINPDKTGNAIAAAGTPNIDRLMNEYCWTQIGASGMDVVSPFAITGTLTDSLTALMIS